MGSGVCARFGATSDNHNGLDHQEPVGLPAGALNLAIMRMSVAVSEGPWNFRAVAKAWACLGG